MLIEHHIEERAHARLCDGRDVVAVLTQEARRLAKGVNELRDATGGRMSGEHLPIRVRVGRVLCVPDAPDFQEAGELKGDDLAKAVRILNGSGVQASGRRERGGST